jgi:hypothetical protein
MCQHGSLLRSPGLLFNEDRLQQELVRERTEKESNVNTNSRNSISPTKSSDSEENKVSVSSSNAISKSYKSQPIDSKTNCIRIRKFYDKLNLFFRYSSRLKIRRHEYLCSQLPSSAVSSQNILLLPSQILIKLFSSQQIPPHQQKKRPRQKVKLITSAILFILNLMMKQVNH